MLKLSIGKSILRLFKGTPVVRVKPHLRDGHHVQGYSRANKPKTTLRATAAQMNKMGQLIEDNIKYLVYMGKVIAQSHGITPMFENGYPTGDLGDLVQEGKMGMLIGGMEWLKTAADAKKKGKEPPVDMLTQMKTRAKQRMRLMAKKLKNTVSLPRDLIRQLAIISTAREQYRQANNGQEASDEELAEMVTLHRRTTDGGKEEYDYDEKLDRIRALREYKNSQYVDELDLNELHVDEDDPTYWTRWSSSQRIQREQVHRIFDRLISEGKLDPQEKAVLWLRFYVDDPSRSWGTNTRSFESITRKLMELSGMKKVQVRKKKGDTMKYAPFKRVMVRTKNGKPTGKYKRERYKTPVTVVIKKVNKDNYEVSRMDGKKTWRIGGKPPFKKVKMDRKDVWDKYDSGIKKILSHADATTELREALELTTKSLQVIVPVYRRLLVLR